MMCYIIIVGDVIAKSSKYFIKLDLIVLSVLQDRDRYAYEITKYIKEKSHGVIVPKQGTIYPIIYQLLEDGCIISRSELYNNKARVYYHLEDKGKEYLKKGIEEYDTLVKAVDLFLHGRNIMTDKGKYIKEVKKIFPISGKREKEFLKGIESQVNELDDLSYQDIIEEMGEPKDIVASYYEEVDSQYLIKKMNTRRLVKWLGIIITIIVLITCLVFAYEVHEERKAYTEQLPLHFEEVIGE